MRRRGRRIRCSRIVDGLPVQGGRSGDRDQLRLRHHPRWGVLRIRSRACGMDRAAARGPHAAGCDGAGQLRPHRRARLRSTSGRRRDSGQGAGRGHRSDGWRRQPRCRHFQRARLYRRRGDREARRGRVLARHRGARGDLAFVADDVNTSCWDRCGGRAPSTTSAENCWIESPARCVLMAASPYAGWRPIISCRPRCCRSSCAASISLASMLAALFRCPSGSGSGGGWPATCIRGGWTGSSMRYRSLNCPRHWIACTKARSPAASWWRLPRIWCLRRRNPPGHPWQTPVRSRGGDRVHAQSLQPRQLMQLFFRNA